MIILHFHLQPQFKKELFHIYTSQYHFNHIYIFKKLSEKLNNNWFWILMNIRWSSQNVTILWSCLTFWYMIRYDSSSLSLLVLKPSATCTSSKMHIVFPQNFCISIVFNFSWGGFNTKEKWKTKVMQNFGGEEGTRWIMGDVKMENTGFWQHRNRKK